MRLAGSCRQEMDVQHPVGGLGLWGGHRGPGALGDVWWAMARVAHRLPWEVGSFPITGRSDALPLRLVVSARRDNLLPDPSANLAGADNPLLDPPSKS